MPGAQKPSSLDYRQNAIGALSRRRKKNPHANLSAQAENWIVSREFMEATPKNAATGFCAEEIVGGLTGLESAMSEWQCALLKRHLAELEKCTARQRDLCQQLGELVLTPGDIRLLDRNQEFLQTATRVREQGRRFAALLRRMRKNLNTLQRALEGPRQMYREPQPMRVSKEF